MKGQEHEGKYSVGQICAMTGVTRKTLFYYDKIGLLTPSERSGTQHFKFYDEEKVSMLKRIITYREAGLGISEIRDMLMEGKPDKLRILQNVRQRILGEKDNVEQEIRNLDLLIQKEAQIKT